MAQTVLILGATGRFGRHAAIAFENADWRVRRFDRRHDDLMHAAQSADVIVNGWNPPYDKWASQVPQLHAQVRAAAKAAGATVILPANVYVFGPDAGGLWDQGTRHLAGNPLGRIRIEMEQAYKQDGVKTILLRAGDFIDTQASGNWFDKIMTPKLLENGAFTYPGAPDQPHVWAFLPDLARAAVALAEQRGDLPDFIDIPFAGYSISGDEMAAALGRVAGRSVRLQQMSWWPILLARPFWPMAKHLLEMRYLWSLPHELNGTRLAALLPDFQSTGIEDALVQALGATLTADQPRQDGGGWPDTHPAPPDHLSLASAHRNR